MVETELQQFVRAYEFMLMRLLLLLLLLLLLPATWTSSPPSRQKKRLRKIRSLLAASFLSEATTELSFHRSVLSCTKVTSEASTLETVVFKSM